jgi:hypothetical protein
MLSVCTLYETWGHVLPQDDFFFFNNRTRFKCQIPEYTVKCNLQIKCFFFARWFSGLSYRVIGQVVTDISKDRTPCAFSLRA